MRQEGLRAGPRRRYKSTTWSDHDQPVSASFPERMFHAEAPDRQRVGETTKLVTSYGKLYLAAIVDLFFKYVVGWALSPVNDHHLTIAALETAMGRRCPPPPLRRRLFFRERGLPKGPRRVGHRLRREPTRQPVRRRSDEELGIHVQDGAGEHLETHAIAGFETFDSIEVFYNMQRRPASLGYVSAAEFERRYRKCLAAWSTCLRDQGKFSDVILTTTGDGSFSRE
jgi:transposase InsO family protein